MRPADELRAISLRLHEYAARSSQLDFEPPLAQVERAADQVGKSWSGSPFGHHAFIYYDRYEVPPEDAHFSVEWGTLDTFTNTETVGDWRRYSADQTRAFILGRAGVSDLEVQTRIAREASAEFASGKAEILSIVHTLLARRPDTLLAELQAQIQATRIYSISDFLKRLIPRPRFSRDSEAMARGIKTPPHLALLAEVVYLRGALASCDELATLAERAASHVQRAEDPATVPPPRGDRVFIGHGQSAVWKDLKDFVQNRLNLPWDEFNRVPVAGVTNVARLREMMESAAIAFLVLTAEDEHADGRVTARENVIHEAGLFQGHLGFTRAIILLEDGCDEFSNIQGLGQIRFPTGNLTAKFEDIRRVLEREGLLER
jgi:predicted nucleotide-binding protein